jgi:hypothetical protein
MDATLRQRPALVGHATAPVAIQKQSLMMPKLTKSRFLNPLKSYTV